MNESMFTQSLILLPLLAVLVFLVPMKWKWPLTLGIVTLGVVCSLGEALSVLIQGAVHVYRGVSNVLFGDQYEVVDILSAVFLLILSLAAFSVTFYARGYVEPKAKQKPPVQISLHYFCLMIMYFSMLIVVTARDGFLFLFAWELMTLASFLLVLFDGDKPKVRRAALNYLILMHVGFMFLLAGFVTLYVNGLPVSFDSLAAYFGRGEVVPLFVVFLISGRLPQPSWLQLIYYAFAASMLALALSYFTCAIQVFFKDMAQIVSICLQFGMWLTPIMYSEQLFLDKGITIAPTILKLNPFYYIAAGYRDSMLTGDWFFMRPTLTLYFWCFTIAAMLVGLKVFKRLRPHFSDVL